MERKGEGRKEWRGKEREQAGYVEEGSDRINKIKRMQGMEGQVNAVRGRKKKRKQEKERTSSDILNKTKQGKKCK